MGKRNSNTKSAVMPLSREDYLRRLAASKVPFNIRLTNNILSLCVLENI